VLLALGIDMAKAQRHLGDVGQSTEDGTAGTIIEFAAVLRKLRRRHVGKQLTLSSSLACTEAAVSQWETGRRLPSYRTLMRIASLFAIAGAPGVDVAALTSAWHRALVSKATTQSFGTRAQPRR
jgi:DNA-binding XRE family transcriptional regulator